MTVSTMARGIRTVARSIGASIVLALAAAPASAQLVMAQGELAAAIRSAGLPCAKVHAATPVSGNTWRVQCNSGEYRVTAKSGGGFDVSTY